LALAVTPLLLHHGWAARRAIYTSAMTTPDSAPPITNGTLVTGEAPADPDGEWLTVTEVIARLGKAERTIRRWIDNGTLQHKNQGGRVLVWMDGVPAATGRAPVDSAADNHQELAVDRAEVTLGQQLALVERLSELAIAQAAPLVAELPRLAVTTPSWPIGSAR